MGKLVKGDMRSQPGPHACLFEPPFTGMSASGAASDTPGDPQRLGNLPFIHVS